MTSLSFPMGELVPVTQSSIILFLFRNTRDLLYPISESRMRENEISIRRDKRKHPSKEYIRQYLFP